MQMRSRENLNKKNQTILQLYEVRLKINIVHVHVPVQL